MKAERKSNIMVEVIEPEGLCKHVLDGLRHQGMDLPEKATLRFNEGKYGLVRTPNGTFMLDEEGVGHCKPLEQADSEIAFCRGDGMFVGVLCTITINRDNMGGLKIKETVNLADFIRSFGSRLEDNYRSWDKFLTLAMAGTEVKA